MQFRNFADLIKLIRESQSIIPRDIDGVVAIPRSGLVPATLIALFENKMLTDVEGFLNNRLIAPGSRRTSEKWEMDPRQWRKVLIVDDSVSSGATLASVKAALKKARPEVEAVSLAVFGAKTHGSQADIVLEKVSVPRMFEWNVMHHPLLNRCCVDIDGVLCQDPLDAENDDGERYEHFLLNAKPLCLPTKRVGALVTSRLAKYRGLTEAWLSQHNVEYDELIMLEGYTANERRALKLHAQHKAQYYKALPNSVLFIESDAKQSLEIQNLSGKPVLHFPDMTIYSGTASQRIVRGSKYKLRRFASALKRRLSVGATEA
ncbi:phosphoribosyltransferase family protein [Qipengyuania aquimaris]|uniref:Phosphoribosyltransferase n=1 Tax=Qipengyuania aquimaris TaxID=255984 RepID=A0A9Q3S0J0_9SPHN|nr:phosphoribosyltransferase family protein [Qipengyuania aquimaris]MBY6217888.1 phosphoribosyltransferase [Qipengyuania aquimaris]